MDNPAPIKREDILSSARNTINQALSGIRQARLTLNDSLTSGPVHPYDKLKHQYLTQKGLSALSIDEIEAPLDFDVEKAAAEIENIQKRLNDESYDRLETISLSYHVMDDLMGVTNPFTTLSGDTYVVDENRVSNHLMFLELVSNLSPIAIERNPQEIAQKVITQYIKTYL